MLEASPAPASTRTLCPVRVKRDPALPLGPLLQNPDPHRPAPTTLHDGWACKKLSSCSSAPRTPRPTAPSGTGVHDGANLTRKPASLRSSARACSVPEGVEPGGVTRAALVSRTASERAAVIVRERR